MLRPLKWKPMGVIKPCSTICKRSMVSSSFIKENKFQIVLYLKLLLETRRNMSCNAGTFWYTAVVNTMSSPLCLMKTVLRTQKVPLLLNLMDELLAGMWNCPALCFGSRKFYSSRGDMLWLKYLRHDRNAMAQRMWVTVTHDWTDYCVQTVGRPFELWCLTLLCWG